MHVSEMLKSRNLPQLQDKKTMIKLLQKYEYGFVPNIPYKITVSEPVRVEARYCDSTVTHSQVDMTVTTQYGSHTFPVNQVLHTDGTVHPFFVFLNFRADVPDRYFPTEEVGDAGFDVLTFCYKDVTSDNDDFSDGLARIFFPNGRQKDDDCGKIMLWAWAASRVLDYAQSLPSLDMNQAAVMGHSRLGKTSLVAGMMDERFRYVFSNCSGCSGAALNRGNSGLVGQLIYNANDIFDYEQDFTTGETIRDVIRIFPYWFCKRYEKCVFDNFHPDFDQHFLVASIAPRYAYIASASRDHWADPVSEFMCGVAASPAYEAMGLTGLIHNEKLPEIDEHFHEGRIGYHLRKGPHFLSRHDWQQYMTYIRKHQFD